MTMKKRFKDKVIIITGGASGIGKTAALEFGLEGAQVIIWDINQTKTSETEEEFKRKNILVEGMYMNTTDPEETQNTAKYIKEKYGSIDVLINNAGITRDATIKKMQYNTSFHVFVKIFGPKMRNLENFAFGKRVFYRPRGVLFPPRREWFERPDGESVALCVLQHLFILL